MLGINQLHKAFENNVRLWIMSMLSANEAMDFSAIKTYLNLTDGNLASHMKVLEKEQFVRMEKTFVGRKTNTKYFITEEGRAAFAAHLKGLEDIISNINK